jgi:site-specific recombinase XerD
LKWASVDLELHQFSVENGDSFETKSGKNRVVPLCVRAEEVLRTLYTQRNASEFVFSRNGFKLNSLTVSHEFKKSVRQAKLPEKLHLHSCRHSACSWMLMAGVSINVIQKILGHSSTELINSTYGHLTEQFKHSEMYKLDSF